MGNQLIVNSVRSTDLESWFYWAHVNTRRLYNINNNVFVLFLMCLEHHKRTGMVNALLKWLPPNRELDK